MIKVINNMDRRLRTKPTLIISLILIVPQLNAIALGAVATGSINAHEAARIAPTIR